MLLLCIPIRIFQVLFLGVALIHRLKKMKNVIGGNSSVAL